MFFSFSSSFSSSSQSSSSYLPLLLSKLYAQLNVTLLLLSIGLGVTAPSHVFAAFFAANL